MGIERSGYTTWEPSRKSLGNVLNALNWVPVKKWLMANFMSCMFYYQKKVSEIFSRLSCYSVKGVCMS